MKGRDHDREVKRLMIEHQREKNALRTQIETLRETAEALRLRAQAAERRAFEAEERESMGVVL